MIRVAFWDILSEEEGDRVIGTVGGDYMESAEEEGNFWVYIHQSDINPDCERYWVQAAQDRAKKGEKA